ncbi:hypothetical protein HV819_02075 [Anaerococcus sp. AGMB00486]|uniref:Uncharacterized protein n=1 Tax=Anaerococcus faecalis TaxID=2742993 RepID=A0ABX2N7W9_9FIRM|nr:hypothetical protein [Anaerococcus faecalis]NVF10786.1 hypothetical protein [Anaerococcus faecalis]
MIFKFINVITPLVSIISIFISHYLGMKKSNKKLEKESLQKRYETVYIPYIQLLARSFPLLPYPINTSEVAITINSITLENIEYLGKNSSLLAIDYYLAMLDFFEYCNGNKAYSNAKDKINTTFIEMTQEILLEASQLSRELKLADISQVFYNEIQNYQ